MKKITFLFFMLFLSMAGFAQGLPLEGFETNPWPANGPGPGWGIYQNTFGTTDKWRQSNPLSPNEPAHSGTYAAFVNNQNVPNPNLAQDWLVTPGFTLPTSPQLRFWSRLALAGNQGGTYKILIAPASSDLTNLTSYTTVITWTEPEINPDQLTYTEKLVDLPTTLPAGPVVVAFLMEGDNADRWLVDDVTVVQKCLAPTALAAGAIGTTTANLTWTPGASETQWEVEVLPAADPQTGVAEATVSAPTYSPSGANALLPDTAYKFYVRAMCSPTNPSAWAGPFNFSTVGIGDTCAAPIVIASLPYSTTDNTANYGDNFEGSPGATGCGTTNGYLNGDEVVYAYTAAVTGIISLDLTGIGEWTGMFVYDDCADIGTNCIGGGTGNTTTPISIPTLNVTAGTTYYVVISTWAAPQSTAYTLIIQTVNCPKPTGLAATGTNATSTNLSWAANGSTSWQVVVQNAGTGIPPVGAPTNTTTNNTAYPVTTTTAGVALTPATAYEYYVRADCNNGTFSAWAGPFAFNTTQIPAAMPFSDGFEGPLTWTLENGSQTNKWVMGTAVNNGGTHSLYVSNDNGVTNAFTNTATSLVHAYKDIQMPTTVDQLALSFDWRALAESCCDYIHVWVVPADYTPVAGQAIGAGPNRIPIGGNFNGNANWSTVNQIISASAYSNNVLRLVFEWRNDPSIGNNPPGAIDNVNLSVITCPSPSNLALDNLTEDSATLSWDAPTSTSPTYDYYYSTSNTPPTAATVPNDNVAVDNVTIGSLPPSTTYYFWVRSNCGPGDTSFWIGPVSFNTPQIPGTLPYTDGFEGATSPWTLVNGTQTNKWVIGTAVSNGGTQSLYISNDNGVTNAFNNGAGTVVHAYRDLQMPDNLDQLLLTYDWRALAESCCDYLRVWVVPITFTPTPGQLITANPPDRIQIGGNHNGNASFTTVNQVIDAADYSGDIIRLVFEWRNDPSVGDNPPAAVDNVNLSVITCPSPSNLAVSGIGLEEATISWDGPTSTTPTFDYYYSETNTPPTGTTTPSGNVADEDALLEDLDPSTIYYVWVRSNCGPGDTSFWIGPLQFNTQCDAFTVPYFEGFNTNSTSEFCWTVLNLNGDGDAWDMNYNGTPFEGNQVASINTDFNNGNNDDWLISPTILLTGNQRLKFHHKILSDFEPNDFEVLMSTTGTDPADFTITVVPLATYSNEEYVEVIVNLMDGATPATGPVNLAWHIPPGGLDGWRVFIDNVIVEDLPPCPEPINAEVSCISTSSANFNWEQGGTETQWEVAIVEGGQPAPANGIIVDDPFYYATDLDDVTNYDFYVRAICPGDEGEVGAWVKINFTTPATSPIDATPMCAPVDSFILFDNVYDDMNVPEYGEVACLFSTPNPVWYYIQIDNPGTLNFQIIQNTAWNETTGTPTGTGLDVDFVAYGPFTSLNEACDQIEYEGCACPNNTTNPNFYPFGNIIDCSYSAAPIENFTIENAQAGQIYAVMITNFDGAQGKIKLQQLDSSTGTTDCDILYNVELGDDQILCGVDDTTLTATVTTPGQAEDITYTWTMDGDPYTPTVIETTDLTQTIAITEPGYHIYAVEITVPNSSNTDPIVDSVIISLGPLVTATEPADYAICDDETNDGIAEFDLTTLEDDALGTLNPAEYSVNFYLTEAAAEAGAPGTELTGIDAYNNVSNPQTVYIRVTSTITAPEITCYDVVPAELIVKPLPITTMPDTYTMCEGDTVTLIGTPDNYTPADNPTFIWYIGGVAIPNEFTNSITVSAAGIYTLEVTLNGCVNTVDTEVEVTPAPQFTFGGPYEACDPTSITIELIPGNFPAGPDATYAWTYLGNDAGTTQNIPATGYGEYFVTVTYLGCSATSSVMVSPDTDAVSVNLGGPYRVCDPELVIIEATGNFDTATAHYVWAFDGTDIPDTDSPRIQATQFGTYSVTVTTEDGCIGTASVPVTEDTDAITLSLSQGCDSNNIYMINVAPGLDANGNPTFDPSTASFSWTGPNGFTSSAASAPITAEGVYNVTITTVDGCISQASLETDTTSCLIPKGISPNGDGMNDTFDLSGFNVTKLSIFNRYGREVFSKNNYTNEWHGQEDGGNELPTGTYFFTMERSNGESKTGWVYINRQEN